MWQVNAYSYEHINFRGVIVNAKQFLFFVKSKTCPVFRWWCEYEFGPVFRGCFSHPFFLLNLAVEKVEVNNNTISVLW